MEKTIYISAGVVILLIFIILFNRLIKRRNQVENIFGSVDALLKKRYDLIPNLISAIQEYMIHKKKLLTGLTELRTRALNPDVKHDEKIDLQNKINRSLEGIMVAVENYPDLKASENFLQLQATLNEVEEQLSAARRAYNAVVTEYNDAVSTIPSNIVAFLTGFKRKAIMETPDQERKNINVKELFKQD